ncbi:MAG: DnaJ domain-containing protein [Myxococcales bacterium]|nr:DnaJ domain-containing protein [Myxococcales bacterium]
MSNINSTNFYEVLGVDKAADARAIKKAYFALVRKYPPETHPEQFKKLREAYEVLSDAESRRDYDSIGQYDAHGEHVGEQIRLATEAMNDQRYTDAQVILAKLINEKPELHFARDMLGLAYLNDKQVGPALELFTELVGKHPDNPNYHLHQGYAQHANKQYAAAAAAYQKSFELNKEDVKPLVSLADCFMDQKRWDDAIRILDQAINLDGTVDFRDFGLFVRKLEVEIERANKPAVLAVLQQLMPIIPDDPAAKRFVANRLASMAAPLFAMKRVDEANVLMREAAKLDPNRGTGAMPQTFEVEIERLPEASKQWLIEQNTTMSWAKVPNSSMGWPIFLLLVGLGGGWVTLMAAFANRDPLPPEGLFFFFVGLALFGLLTAWCIRRIILAAKSPYGSYTFVHALFLLQVRLDKVFAWPLANLHDVRVTHHHTNGVYTTSRIDLVFNRRTFTVNIYGQQASVDWANAVLQKRRRMLELMYSGMLEEGEEDTRLIPANLIPEEGKPAVLTEAAQQRKKNGRITLAAVVGAAAVVTGVFIPINAAKADHAAWEDAKFSYRGKVPAYQKYLYVYPDGRHADEAKAAIAQIYAAAEERVKAHQESELAPALLDVLKLLKEKQLAQVNVKYVSHTSFEKLDLDELPADLKGTVIDPKLAFSDTANQQREARITESLSAAFNRLLGDGVVSISREGADPYSYEYRYRDIPKPDKSPVTFVVNYEVALTGTIYESVKKSGSNNDEKKFLGIMFLWDFDVAFDGEEKPRYTFQFDSEPAKNIKWTTYGYGSAYESPTLPYDKMAESGFDDFQHQIAVRFGVEEARPKEAAYDDSPPDDGYDDGYDEPPPPRPAPKKPTAKKPAGKKK